MSEAANLLDEAKGTTHSRCLTGYPNRTLAIIWDSRSSLQDLLSIHDLLCSGSILSWLHTTESRKPMFLSCDPSGFAYSCSLILKVVEIHGVSHRRQYRDDLPMRSTSTLSTRISILTLTIKFDCACRGDGVTGTPTSEGVCAPILLGVLHFNGKIVVACSNVSMQISAIASVGPALPLVE